MDDTAIIALIKEGLAQVAPDRTADFASIQMASTIESLGLDSIATMELVGHVEDEMGVTFPDEDLATVATVGDLANLARREQG